jgi:ribosomal protein L37AE/L43A
MHEQMCYNCRKPTTKIYWAGITVCVNCGNEYENVPNLQTGLSRGEVSENTKEPEKLSG